MDRIWTQKFKIMSFQIDRNNNLSMHALSGIFQEAAGEHARTLGFGYEEMTVKGWVWVLSRIKIKISRIPTWREEVNLRTWVVERGRMLSRRDFELLDKDGKRLVSAVTMWALLDLKAKRPVVLEKIDFGFPYRPEERVMEEEPGKLTVPAEARDSGTYRVKYSDIDMNGHMNNIHYVRIVVDSYPLDWLDTHIVREMEINYRAEARINDELLIRTHSEGDNFIHQVVNQEDGRTVAVVRIVWDIR